MNRKNSKDKPVTEKVPIKRSVSLCLHKTDHLFGKLLGVFSMNRAAEALFLCELQNYP